MLSYEYKHLFINWLSKKKLTLVLLFRFIIRFWFFLQFFISPIWHSVQEDLLDNNFIGIIKWEHKAPVGLDTITITDTPNTTTWKVKKTFILGVVLYCRAWFNTAIEITMDTKAIMSLENNRLNLHVLTSTHKYNNPLRKCDISMISPHVERKN